MDVHNGTCRRCFDCGISYPPNVMICMVDGCAGSLMHCEGQAQYDWRDEVADRNGDLRESERMRMQTRFNALHAAGWDNHTSDFLATGHAPLGQMVAAANAGCTSLQALAIWG